MDNGNIFHFLPEGGETGKLIRSIDWSRTQLGPVGKWPESLRMSLSLCLGSRFPMLIWWGRDLIMLYNDGYKEMLGESKHPQAMGAVGKTIWPEIWHVVGPMLESVIKEGQATWSENQILSVDRFGYTEESYWTFSYSPIRSSNEIVGIFTAVYETTQQVIAQRRLDLIRMFGQRLTEARTVTDACLVSASILEGAQADIPFSLIYLFDKSRNTFILQSSTGLEDSALCPPIIGTEDTSGWPLFQVIEERGPVTVENAARIHNNLPGGPWPESSHTFVMLPLAQSEEMDITGVLVAGVSPRRRLDDEYSKFLRLVAGQVMITISNANAYEEERKRAEALAEIDRAKTTFFGNVSHEFRTPLTLMLGPVNEMLGQTEANQITADRETLLLVQRNAMRLQKLVNTLLDFSRIEAGRIQATFRPTDLAEFTGELASNFRSAIQKAGLVLEVSTPPLPENVYIDREMWEKVVLNLISNAFKFTFEGKISVSVTAREGFAELIVSDTGIGISRENIGRLFERFRTVPNVRSRTHEGSGIGLALVSELVKLHGGTVSVQSEPDKGTTFTVRIPFGKDHLPADQVQSSATAIESTSFHRRAYIDEAARWLPDEGLYYLQHATHSGDDGPKPVVLLADDNADMRSYIKSLLKDLCDIKDVSSGRDAIKLARAHEPELILSDVMMPDIDGFEMLKILRSDPALRSIPVILLSARAGEEARIEGFQAGADDYLVKPFGRTELIARVSSNLQLSRLRREVQEAVKYSEAQLRALVTATSNVVYRMSPDWKIMRQLDGRSFLKDVGEPLSNWQEKYIHPKDRPRVSEAIEQAIRTRSIFNLEHQVIQADGKTGWVVSRAIPILDKNDQIIEWFGAASDITSRKQYEKELEEKVRDRTKALKRSNDDLQQFAHVASHDLKEPVRKIKTFTYRLLDEIKDSISEKGQQYLEKVLMSAERMTTMIEGVLTYSSLNGAKLELETIPLETIIDEIRNDLEIVIHQKKAEIVHDELPVIKGGRVLIYQLFYNLLNNSLKFSHPGRSPVISIDSRVTHHNDHPYFEIRVSDNGIGFDNEEREKIFETFTRLHAKNKYDGTGLGLALCRKIVERHSGSIAAESRPDEGSVFTVLLPVDPESIAQA